MYILCTAHYKNTATSLVQARFEPRRYVKSASQQHMGIKPVEARVARDSLSWRVELLDEDEGRCGLLLAALLCNWGVIGLTVGFTYLGDMYGYERGKSPDTSETTHSSRLKRAFCSVTVVEW